MRPRATDDYFREHGNEGPKCPLCGREMYAENDNGLFLCRFCNRRVDIAPPPVFIFLQVDMGGITFDCLDDLEYQAAVRALEEERRQS